MCFFAKTNKIVTKKESEIRRKFIRGIFVLLFVFILGLNCGKLTHTHTRLHTERDEQIERQCEKMEQMEHEIENLKKQNSLLQG